MSPTSTTWPLGYLRTHGPAADSITQLQWGLSIVSIGVVVAVSIALFYGLRPRAPLAPGELAGGEEGGQRWIVVGLALTIPVLLACAVWTLRTLSTVSAAPAAAMTIEVRSHQWWWQVRYPEAAGLPAFETANEIHVPQGRPIRFVLTSSDVIHSFWIPQLAGKADVIPGQTTQLWLQADRAGEYRGQCGEFCGAQHAHMGLLLVAEPQAAFDAWRRREQSTGTTPATTHVQTGQALFVAACGRCHAVRGTAAHGNAGPDLTHVRSRHALAAELLPMNRGNLAGWIANPQALKPSALMPPSALAPEQLQAVLDYVWSLE